MKSELPPDDLAIVTVDDRDEVPPAIVAAGNVSNVHGPPPIARRSDAAPPSYARSWILLPLMHEPAFEL
jgi:hypothetical protein